MPGTTKPATPITSLTFTDIARMPGGIDGGSPAPASSGASFVSVKRLVRGDGADQAAADDVLERREASLRADSPPASPPA